VPFEPDSDETFSLIGHVVDVAESFEPNLVRGAICSLIAAERMHRDGYRVALCGEGADELFCGYAPLELTFSQGGAGDNGEDSGGYSVRDECLLLMPREPAACRSLLHAASGGSPRAVSRSVR
jgi:asparagine synthase (glutamine-hydrolysing)